MDTKIRSFRPEDAEAVRGIHLRAFGGLEEALLVEAVHASGNAPVSLVAEAEPGRRLTGHVLFSPVGLAYRETPSAPIMVGLAPVGVLPEYQGGGIGSLLVREGLAACREAGYDAAVVLGEPGYYSRFGFGRASDYGLGNEYGVDEHFMVLELSRGVLDGAGGTVRYGPEFR